MYNSPIQFINSYPINFRAINACSYIPLGEQALSSLVTLKGLQGRALYPMFIDNMDNYTHLHTDLLHYKYGRVEVDNITTFGSEAGIIHSPSVRIDTISTLELPNPLSRGGLVTTNEYSTLIVEPVIIRNGAANFKTYSTTDVAGNLNMNANTKAGETTTLSVDGDVIKILEVVYCKPITTFQCYLSDEDAHIYRGGVIIEVEEKFEVDAYVKQWATFINPQSKLDTSLVYGISGGSNIDNIATMVADSWVKQWVLLISNSSMLEVDGGMIKDGYVIIQTSSSLDVTGNIIHKPLSLINIDNYVDMNFDAGVLFDTCDKLYMVDRSCYKF